MTETFYQRPLPSNLIAFASKEGKQIFQEALLDKTLDGFFPLIQQFSTQQEPAYCGLSSLSMVLNALGIDPNRRWKGPWRWYAEELLDCCVPLHMVQKQGISLHEFQCLARCNGVICDLVRPSIDDNVSSSTTEKELQEFRQAILNSMTQFDDNQQLHSCVVVSFDRRVLNQTGTGHFSPIGGYNKKRDLVLVLDSARFKYPPFWVDIKLLYEAMKPIDPMTKMSRGYFIISKNNCCNAYPAFCQVYPAVSWEDLFHTLKKTADIMLHSDAQDVQSLIRIFIDTLEVNLMEIIRPFEAIFDAEQRGEQKDNTELTVQKDKLTSDHLASINRLFNEIQNTHTFSIVDTILRKGSSGINPQEKSENKHIKAFCSCKCSSEINMKLSPSDIKSVLLTVLYWAMIDYLSQTLDDNNSQAILQIYLSSREEIMSSDPMSSNYVQCIREVDSIRLKLKAIMDIVQPDSN
jgi:hypothetical protein